MDLFLTIFSYQLPDESLLAQYGPAATEFLLNNSVWLIFLLSVLLHAFIRVSKRKTFYAWLEAMEPDQFVRTVMGARALGERGGRR